jgi:hypothetical protein
MRTRVDWDAPALRHLTTEPRIRHCERMMRTATSVAEREMHRAEIRRLRGQNAPPPTIAPWTPLSAYSRKPSSLPVEKPTPSATSSLKSSGRCASTSAQRPQSRRSASGSTWMSIASRCSTRCTMSSTPRRVCWKAHTAPPDRTRRSAQRSRRGAMSWPSSSQPLKRRAARAIPRHPAPSEGSGAGRMLALDPLA